MQLNSLLENMKMDFLFNQLDSICEQASKHDLNYKEFLFEALLVEYRGKQQKGIESRLRAARFPWRKTLEQFDLDFQPSIDKKVIRELSSCGFVDIGENIVLLGPPGVGKTHLAVAFGGIAIECGHKVLFITQENLLTRLSKALEENRIERQLQQFVYPKVLIIDEIGYLPIDRQGAALLFRLLSRRYEKVSTIITSNKTFIDWGEMFNDQVIATAILDRLLHHCTTINIKGNSYRLKEKQKAGLINSDKLKTNGG